ncbi:hypothetical protein CDL15_Pgr008243 [Punica granatum]|uniref:Uncharacterized protein n=1 Tax=Punica granatum TaxID=22663 RepID=A0A218VUF2_PUNGR|nr:hypothetical protein CDL15_Pgr008243 [Punica granatum]
MGGLSVMVKVLRMGESSRDMVVRTGNRRRCLVAKSRWVSLQRKRRRGRRVGWLLQAGQLAEEKEKRKKSRLVVAGLFKEWAFIASLGLAGRKKKKKKRILLVMVIDA